MSVHSPLAPVAQPVRAKLAGPFCRAVWLSTYLLFLFMLQEYERLLSPDSCCSCQHGELHTQQPHKHAYISMKAMLSALVMIA